MFRSTGSGLLVARIAWASLLRRRTRTVLVVLMIAMSLWGLLFMQGLYEGMYEQMIDNAIRSGSGHLTIYAKGYRLEPDIKKLITNIEEVARFLAKDQRVASVVSRINQEALAATANYSRNAKVLGVELGAEQKHGRLADYLRQGELAFGPKARGAVVGSGLAKKLKISLGHKLVLSAQATDNEVSAIALKVRGIIKTNNLAIDDGAVFIDQAKAAEFLGIGAGVTQVCVILHSEEEMVPLQQALRQKFTDLEVFRWDELYPALMQSRVMMEGFSYVTYLLVFAVAALGIFGVILVSILERIREFGIMLAIGTEFALIRKIVLFESFIIGFLGYLSGSLLGGLTLNYFRVHGLDLTAFSEGLDAFGLDAIMYSIIKPDYFVTAFLAVLLATILSVIFPLRVLKKARPIEAITKL
ncbi:MAG: ABC transporter permease [Desulfobulbaceae bacterium]|nr:ABC transporter permease [Desulfobulbaceae bacterium]HIJ79652.1 ABC transporter permease [Deltaproteobacteria bacterium]